MKLIRQMTLYATLTPVSARPSACPPVRPSVYPPHAAVGIFGLLYIMTNTFGARSTLKVGGRTFEIFRLDALARAGVDVHRLPYSLRILLENLLRT